MKEKYHELQAMIEAAKNVVFFGGAGVSTASGIPDFRGQQGLYTANRRAEEYLSIGFFERHPEEFYDFYRTSMLYPEAQPNAVHRALAVLEREGKLSAVITQNIDGLHQKAGNHRVLELHGTTQRNSCMRCGAVYGPELILEQEGIPRCPRCSGRVRPDVVLYGEGLDGRTWTEAEEAIRACDLLLVGGTSLTVHPAASLVTVNPRKRLVILNASPTPYDGLAELILRDPLTDIFEE